MNSIEDTAQNMSPSLRSALSKAETTYRLVFGLLDKHHSHRKKADEAQVKENSSKIQFTGQYTDIAYADTEEMTTSNIRKICGDDKKLYNSVIENYTEAVREGHLQIERVNNENFYTLTDKGRELINSEAFRNQFEKDQRNFMCNTHKNTACIQFTGEKSDINIFRFTDSFNINSLSGDKKQISHIQKMIKNWQKYGFAEVDQNGNVTATEKCRSFFKQQDLQSVKSDMAITKINPQNLDKVAQNLKSTTAETVKKATKETAKQTISTAAKTGASTASGAATGGVSTAIMAVIELSKKGIQFLDNNLQRSASK